MHHILSLRPLNAFLERKLRISWNRGRLVLLLFESSGSPMRVGIFVSCTYDAFKLLCAFILESGTRSIDVALMMKSVIHTTPPSESPSCYLHS